jgi:hypothetical protein
MKGVIVVALSAAMVGAFAALHAKLPAAPPESNAEKAADAQKAAATKAKEADLLNKAQEKAVANYKKNRGASVDRKKN